MTLLGVKNPVWLASQTVGGFNLSDLVAYYKFNEASGDLLNEAANVGSVDSNAVDFTNNSGVTQGVAGLIGDAYSYDSTNGQSSDGAASTDWEFMYNTTTGIFSYAAWIKFHNAAMTSEATLFDNSNNVQSTGISMVIAGGNNTRTVSFRLSKSDNSQQIFTTPSDSFPSDGAYHFVFVSWDANGGANNVQMSVDDGTKSLFTSTISGISGASALAMTLASTRVIPIGMSDADFDEWSYWNRVLTDAEVTALYNSGNGLEL